MGCWIQTWSFIHIWQWMFRSLQNLCSWGNHRKIHNAVLNVQWVKMYELVDIAKNSIDHIQTFYTNICIWKSFKHDEWCIWWWSVRLQIQLNVSLGKHFPSQQWTCSHFNCSCKAPWIVLKNTIICNVLTTFSFQWCLWIYFVNWY